MADAAVIDPDHERHRREEAERRAKRKASKSSKSKEQIEKDRKRKEYRQEVLRKHGQAPATSKRSSSSHSKSRKEKGSSSSKVTEKKPPSSSKFQELFEKRTQGFQIDFLFRNAPPRPPVGPCFVSKTLDAALVSLSKTYDPNNAVEANHIWKLHNDSSLGYPLAPSAMDPKSYNTPREPGVVPLHKDDAALLDWKGSLGDSLAEAAHRRKEEARAAARLVASGQSPARPKSKAAIKPVGAKNSNKFSRVLKDDTQQPWMKKTTYLSNDYSRKVHDFKSLARTKEEMAQELASKQEELNARRSVVAIRNSFSTTKPLQHPHKKELKPKRVMNVLPQTKRWGRAFTHVVIDKAPTSMPEGVTLDHLAKSFVTNVQKPESSSRLACSVQVPAPTSTEEQVVYRPAFSYDLEVVPLKQEDVPHMTFCFMMEGDTVTYVPVASRVQLMTGRPAKKMASHPLERRPLTGKEQEEMEERIAEVDSDMAEKHHISKKRRRVTDDSSDNESDTLLAPPTKAAKNDDGDDDGMNDYPDSDSDED